MQPFVFQIAVDRAASQCLDLFKDIYTKFPGEIRNQIYSDVIALSSSSYNLCTTGTYVQHLLERLIYFLDSKFVPEEVRVEITRRFFASFERLYDGINVLDIPTVLATPHLYGVVPLFCTRRLAINISGYRLRKLDDSIPTLKSPGDSLKQHTYRTLQECLAPLLTIPEKSTFALEICVKNEESNARIEHILEAVRGVVEVFREEDAEVKVECESGCMGYPQSLMPFFDMGWREWREVLRQRCRAVCARNGKGITRSV
jgi:hypothetical protein